MNARERVVLVVAAAIAMSGCACEASVRSADDAAARDGSVMPAPPARAEWSCRTGWRATTLESGARVCEPWPSDGPITCAPGEAAIPGRGCVTIGGDCPDDGWPADLGTSSVVYARAGATDGDGTRERPYGSLAEALANRRGAQVVALAVGEYEGGLTLEVPLLVGACASRTIIRDPGGDSPATLVVIGTPSEIRGVTVVNPAGNAMQVIQGVTLAMRGVVLESSATAALIDSDAHVVMEDVVLRSPEGASGRTVAARVSSRSSLTVHGGWLRGAVTTRANVDGMPSVVLEDVAIQDTPAAIGGELGRIEAHGLVIERVSFAMLAPDELEIDDVLVRGVHAASPFDPPPGGILAEGVVSAERLWLTDVEGPALVIAGSSSAMLSDVVVDDVTAQHAVRVLDGTRATLERIAITNVRGDGILADGAGTALTLHDAAIRDLAPDASSGDALSIGLGASATIVRAAVRGTARSALFVAGPGTHVDVSEFDVDVRGRGVMAQCATMPGERCSEDAPEVAVTLASARLVSLQGVAIGADQAHVTLHDVQIDGVEAVGPLDGFGIAAIDATVEGARIDVLRATRHAVLAYGATASVDVEALTVGHTRPSPPCEGDACPIDTAGNAITCAEGASLALRDFTAHDAAYAGLLSVQGCQSPRLGRGRIVANTYGVITDESTAGWRPPAEVVITANEVNFDSMSYRVERPTL